MTCLNNLFTRSFVSYWQSDRTCGFYCSGEETEVNNHGWCPRRCPPAAKPESVTKSMSHPSSLYTFARHWWLVLCVMVLHLTLFFIVYSFSQNIQYGWLNYWSTFLSAYSNGSLTVPAAKMKTLWGQAGFWILPQLNFVCPGAVGQHH